MTIVLDASALLTAINREPGHEKLTPALLSSAVCSTVNLAEVHSKLVGLGIAADDAMDMAMSPVHDVVDFTISHAMVTGGIIPQTRALGLSLGDRACLALGISLKAPVYTADRAWQKLKLPVRVFVIR